MSDSVQPHRRQPTRLPRPWDSPGKNTGMGCHFILQCVKVKSESEVAQSSPTPSDPMDCKPTRLLCPWDFPGKSTRVGCHCLLRRPWSNEAPAPQHLSLCSRTQKPQLLSPLTATTEAHVPRARAPQQEKSVQWDA